MAAGGPGAVAAAAAEGSGRGLMGASHKHVLGLFR